MLLCQHHKSERASHRLRVILRSRDSGALAEPGLGARSGAAASRRRRRQQVGPGWVGAGRSARSGFSKPSLEASTGGF